MCVLSIIDHVSSTHVVPICFAPCFSCTSAGRKKTRNNNKTVGGGHVSPVGVLQGGGGGGLGGDHQRHHQYGSGPSDDQAMRGMRRLSNDVDTRDQQHQMRSMQPGGGGLHGRRAGAGGGQQLGGGGSSSLDQNFYGGGPHDDYSHSLGAPPRSSQQQFMPGGGGVGGPGGLRPPSRESHDMRYPGHAGSYRDHQQPPHSSRGGGYNSQPPYGFLPPQMNSGSHGGYGGPGGGHGGDNGDVAVSGVLNGRANLRPAPQSRLSVARPRAQRVLPPSPGRGSGGVPGMSSGIMEGNGEGGRQGGSLSPFVGHQPTPHLGLPLPPVMSGGSFPRGAFQGLGDWDDGHVDTGGGGGPGGGGGGGPGEGCENVAWLLLSCLWVGSLPFFFFFFLQVRRS